MKINRDMETNSNKQESSLNEYHRKRSIELQRIIEEMAPYTIEQAREQQKRIENLIRNSMIEHIVSYLKEHESIIESYSWTFDISDLKQLVQISKKDKDYFLNPNIAPFDKTIKLKEILTPLLQDKYINDKEIFNKIALWLIKKWGGIYSGNNTELINLIHETIDNFENNVKINYKCISSKSKVLCFMFPESNIIYDSRVAYTLNWILLIKSFGDQKYFPIPEGRNSKLNAFDMRTLIRVKNIRIYLGNIGHINHINKRDKAYFIPENLAYHEMNELVKDVNTLLWDSQPERKKEPFFTQMLLFTLADIVIFKEMKSQLKKALSS